MKETISPSAIILFILKNPYFLDDQKGFQGKVKRETAEQFLNYAKDCNISLFT